MHDPIPPLMSTAALAARLGEAGLVVADATYHLPNTGRDAGREYLDAHLPGAVFFDVDAIKDPSNPLPHMIPSVADFSGMIREKRQIR